METVITDKAGRRLTLRKVGVLETLRLYKALGAELSENDSYVGVAVLAARTAMIDDVPIPFPTTEQAVEDILGRLGTEGAEAVALTMRPQSIERIVAEAGN